MAEQLHGKSPGRDPAQADLLAADELQRQNPGKSLPRGAAGTVDKQTGELLPHGPEAELEGGEQ